MRWRFPIVLALDHPELRYRWELVASVYETARTTVEGTLALCLISCVGGARGGLSAFAALAVIALVIFAARLWDRRQFLRAHAVLGESMTGTPERWMMRHAVGALAAAGAWGATDLLVLVWRDDVQLQLFTLMIQAGWVGGATTRAAASPWIVLGQIMLSYLPTEIGLILAPISLVKLAIPVGVVHIAALLRNSQSLGALLIRSLESQFIVEQANDGLAKLNATLTRLSMIDGMTAIANRRGFDEKLDIEWRRALRERTDIALILIDVDFFKRYNDHYGHLAGDDCLRAVARLLQGALLRPADLAARFGGEEFVALLPATGGKDALVVAERVRAAVESAAMPHEMAPLGRVSISLGSASVRPQPGDDPQSLIRLADGALYDAKRGGRDRVHGAGHSRDQLSV